MNTCLVKYFDTPAITRNEVTNVLKNLLWTPVGEIRQLEESGEFPACMRLLVRSLLHDLETGRADTLFSILNYFNCKALG
jgi:hypothetical protein